MKITPADILVDNTDLRQITFAGDWVSSSALTDAFNSTIDIARSGGATATFVFTGTRVAVVGSVFPENLAPRQTSQYVLDNAGPVEFTSPRVVDILNEQQFFESPLLPNGQHTLIITTLAPGYALDYITYTPPPQNTRDNKDDRQRDKEGKNRGTPVGQRSDSDSKKFPLNIALASILGGLLLVAIIIMSVLLYKRRKRRRADESAENWPYRGGSGGERSFLHLSDTGHSTKAAFVLASPGRSPASPYSHGQDHDMYPSRPIDGRRFSGSTQDSGIRYPQSVYSQYEPASLQRASTAVTEYSALVFVPGPPSAPNSRSPVLEPNPPVPALRFPWALNRGKLMPETLLKTRAAADPGIPSEDASVEEKTRKTEQGEPMAM